MTLLPLAIGKISTFIITKLLGRNASTWPGHLALKINAHFIKNVIQKNPQLKIIFIAGTNGKTTTTKALNHILQEDSISVIRNRAGANLMNGFASLIIKHANIQGKIPRDAVLFEVDENALPKLVKQVKPQAIILLNLFRDQLDRFGEINTIAEKWENALQKTENTLLIANADDPQIVKITKQKRVHYFTIPNKLKTEKSLSHAIDSTLCPNCQSELTYSRIAYSHIGNFSCPKCGFKNPKALNIDIKTTLKGSFNTYNLTAAVLLSEKIFNIAPENSREKLNDFKPAFGRQEIIDIQGKNVLILLSKNPTGFNESLKVMSNNNYSHSLIILNDRVPDGRDISWIWDVDFELLGKNSHTTISGDRTYDMSNRLLYAGMKNIHASKDLKKALQSAIKRTPKGETIAILATYSGMLEVRKLLTGKSIL